MDDSSYHYQLEIPISEAPSTVVSLIPSMTESLFDLQLGDRLVAVTDYCIHPADAVAKLPRIGGPKNPDVQRIIDMSPGLVLANQEENRREDVEVLQAAGIPVWVTFPKVVADVFNLLWNIMYLFDETAMVPRIRLIEQTYDWVQGISKTREDSPCSVFVPIWHDPLMTFNADTYIHDVLRVCGGTNVFAGHDVRYPQVTMDDVVAAQPDVILLPSEPYSFTEEHITLFAALDVPAVHHNQIHLIDGTFLTWHGTRLAYALDTLPALLCPMDEL